MADVKFVRRGTSTFFYPETMRAKMFFTLTFKDQLSKSFHMVPREFEEEVVKLLEGADLIVEE